MNIKRYLIATLAVFVFISFYEWLVNGVLLISTYKETPHLWRTVTEMIAKMPLAVLYRLALSAWLAFIFAHLYPEGGLRKGLLFGIFFGVFAGILTGSWYLWLPVSEKLGLSWLLSGIGQGVGAGTILGATYRR